MDDIVYHYTGAEALLGILGRQKDDLPSFRMTNIQYLNDSSELQHGAELYFDYLNTTLTTFEFGKIDEENVSEYVNRFINSLFQDQIAHCCYYSLSFTSRRDCVRQWMSYCPNGGYAIGVSTDDLLDTQEPEDKLFSGKTKYLNVDEASLTWNIYEHDEQFSRLIRKVSQYQEIQNGESEVPHDKRSSHRSRSTARIELQAAIAELCAVIFRGALFIKNPSFADEEEYRVIRNNADQQAAYTDVIEMIDNVGFYTKNQILVPFTTLKIPKASIKEIIVGPTALPELSARSLRKLLERQEIDAGVRISEVPLRSL
jgi:hypothetical protein